MSNESVLSKQAPPNSGEKTSLLEKISFFTATAGVTPGVTIINGWLLFFYTRVVGLSPAAIGTLFLVARLADGLNDPVMGFLVDHLPKTKMGRFRPYLMIFSVVYALNFMLMWFGPQWAPRYSLLIAYITYLLIGISHDLMDVPHNCILPVMTDNERDRNFLSLLKGVALTIGGSVFGLPLALMISENATSEEIRGVFNLIIAAITVTIIVLVCLGSLGIKERISAEEEQKYSFKELLSILRIRPVYAFFLAQLLVSIGSSTGATTGPFFAMYILKNMDVLAIIPIFFLIAAIPGMLVAPTFANRMGKRKAYLFGMTVTAAAGALRLISPSNIPLMFTSIACATFGSCISSPVAFAIHADNTDYVEYVLNKRAEGAVASLASFVTKASGGIGGAFAGYLLEWTKFTNYTDEQLTAAETAGIFLDQPKSAQNGIVVSTLWIPVITVLLAGIVFYKFYTVDKARMEEITMELRERRAAKIELAAEAGALEMDE